MPADRDCNVKGTLGAGGDRLYYVPTDPEYQQISVDPARGERLFCSDEEARLAGWTRPPGARSRRPGQRYRRRIVVLTLSSRTASSIRPPRITCM